MKKIILEGKEIGETDLQAVPGVNIQVPSGKQGGHTTFKTYKVESVDADKVNVTENPLLG
ncbi:MAG: hypothetical protein ACXABY_18340 [Candidatus Thorarchaeota archaeon]|jgi:hypothetical protein